MDLTRFLASIALAAAGPLVAIAYLRGLLAQALRGACDQDASPEFWIRCATLMAVTGTLLLTVGFGQFDERATLLDAVRRALWLTLLGVFATVTVIWRNVRAQVQAASAHARMAAALSARLPAPAAAAPSSVVAAPGASS
ncbi:MAG: hypothetical protein ACTHL8_09280 [Burkholderiaceae bacterium]